MEYVILVNEQDEEVGILEKMEAHRQGKLHRAFSIFIFNEKNEMLLQQRSLSKYHSGGLWTNACCSHPRPDEDIAGAATRRLNEELGFITPLKKVFDFIYKASFDNGLTEHEFDHVFVGNHTGQINPTAGEVQDYAFVSLDKIEEDIKQNSGNYTAWFCIAFPQILKWAREKEFLGMKELLCIVIK